MGEQLWVARWVCLQELLAAASLCTPSVLEHDPDRNPYHEGCGWVKTDLAAAVGGLATEPDIEAAVRTFKARYEGGAWSTEMLVKFTVQAALAGRLVLPTGRSGE